VGYFILKQQYVNNSLKSCLAVVLKMDVDNSQSYSDWVSKARNLIAVLPEIKECSKEKPDPLFGTRWRLSNIDYASGKDSLSDEEIMKCVKLDDTEKELLKKFSIDYIHLHEKDKMRILTWPSSTTP
jgi:Cu2+-containing amine oxidase